MTIRKRRSASDIIDAYFDDLDKWFEDFEGTFAEKPSWNLKNCAIEPLREILLTPTEVLVTVDLPFTTKDAVKVKPLSNNSLEISARMKRKICLDDLGVSHCKGEFQKFHSHIHLPVPVNMDKMEVRFKKGLLEVHLPRKH